MDLSLRGPKRLLTNYRDHWVELSNGTIMRVGVCVNCKESLVSGEKVREVADGILKKHKEYWADDPRSPESLQNVSIVDANGNEKSFLEKKRREQVTETEKLQKQKDDFQDNHEREAARMEREKAETEAREEKRILKDLRKWDEFDPETLPDSNEKDSVKN